MFLFKRILFIGIPIILLFLVGAVIFIDAQQYNKAQNQKNISTQKVLGSHTKNTINPAISISPIASNKQTSNVNTHYSSSTDSSLHNCVINGQVLKLTYSQCSDRLNQSIAQDEQNLQAAPTAMYNTYKQYYADQAKIYSQELTPAVSPMNVSPVLTQTQQGVDNSYVAQMQADEQEAASICTTTKDNETYQIGQAAANAAANGIGGTTSGVEQSQEARIKQNASDNLQQTIVNATGQINILVAEGGSQNQANQIILQLQAACSLN